MLTRLVKQNRQYPKKHVFIAISSIGISLFLTLLIIRIKILGFSWLTVYSSTYLVPRIILIGYHDLAYVLTLTLAFIIIVSLTDKSNLKSQLFMILLFLWIAFLSIFIGQINKDVIPILGGPFNYRWLYYSDFLRGREAVNAIIFYSSWSILLEYMKLSLIMVLILLILYCVLSIILQKITIKPIHCIIIIALFIIYFLLASWYIDKKHWDLSKIENPVISFLQSIITSQFSHVGEIISIDSNISSTLLAMETPFGREDFQATGENQLRTPKPNNWKKFDIKNVIIFVLESVPAQFIYNAGNYTHVITPNLNEYSKESAIFDNIYAHAPASQKGLLSILCSVYPLISWDSITDEYPSIKLTSISIALKDNYHRTAFFQSGNNSFQRNNYFLPYHKFDVIKDYTNLICYRQKFSQPKDWFFMESYDDQCIVDAFTDWVSQDPEEPFFAVLWANQTHMPYYFTDEEINFGVDNKDLNRYLNALHHSDKMLRILIDWLKDKKLYDSTLIVVLGDHGEAFGTHDQRGHASKIYEENVHIPLILINRKLFTGDRYDTIGGLIDVAPTIMDILGLPVPSGWQGRSLFSDDRSNRVYFFSPWSYNNYFGLRENNLKLIYNGTLNRYEIYDLKKDPNEIDNIARSMPKFVEEGKYRLAAWVQFQNKFFESVLAESDQEIK